MAERSGATPCWRVSDWVPFSSICCPPTIPFLTRTSYTEDSLRRASYSPRGLMSSLILVSNSGTAGFS